MTTDIQMLATRAKHELARHSEAEFFTNTGRQMNSSGMGGLIWFSISGSLLDLELSVPVGEVGLWSVSR